MEPQATKEVDYEKKNLPTNCKKEVKEVAQKKRKKRKIEESDSDEVVEVDDGKHHEVNARPLNQRITPKQFMKVIKDMPETHVKATKDIGFGSFLELDLDAHKSIFLDQFVRSFNPNRVSLVLDKNQEIDITIHVVYGLPMSGELIEEPFQEIDETWKEVLRRWRGLFGMTSGSPSNSNVIVEIKRVKHEPVFNNFLLHFIICAINCCIRSTTNTSLNYKFLYSCMDTTKIKHLNWCEYAYRSLISSTIEWQDGFAFFTGPLPFLMIRIQSPICYFYRLQRSKIENPRQFPLISIWKKELIRERMKIENKRGFGKGLVIDRMQIIHVEENEQHSPQDSSKSTKEIMDFIENFGSLAKTLARNINEMYSMLEKAKEMFQEQETSDQMNNLIHNIWNKYIKKKKAQVQNSPSIISQDQHLFDEPSFIKELDDVMKKAWDKCKGKKKHPIEMSPPSFELISQTPPQVHNPKDKATTSTTKDFDQPPST
ncbi:Succinate--CoA ligase [ADP-forming] subunit beta [Bienertia sinuspersici]